VPELPEVETVVRGLRPALEGRRFTRIVARRPDLRRPIPPDLGHRLTGARIEAITRRAKYGLIATDRGDTLIFHLGMSGRMRLDPTDTGPHDHVEWHTDAGRRIVLTDPRRFGSLDLCATDALGDHPLLAGLGPEPLSPAFSAPYLAERFAARIAPVKALLLDSRTVAGIGNIYACEALHRARIHPAREAGAVKPREIRLLVGSVKTVLAEAIEAGGSSLRDHVQPDGVLGYFQKRWRVYGREDEPCPACSRPVTRLVQSNRSSFVCEACQR
jgi:formamidopyrimidine-DNA glycosylase